MPNLTSNNPISDRGLSPPQPTVQHHVPEELLLVRKAASPRLWSWPSPATGRTAVLPRAGTRLEALGGMT